MASNLSAMTAKSVLAKISEGHLECSICSTRFTEPKMLECLHSFCLECLVELKERLDRYSSRLKCPVCRGETKLKGNNVEELPSNFRLKSLVEEVAKQEELLEGQGSPSPSPPPSPPPALSPEIESSPSAEVESSPSAEVECPKEEWWLHKEIGSCIPEQHEIKNFNKIFYVAAFSDNEIAALQYGKSELIRIITTRKLKYYGSISHQHEIAATPRLLAVNKDNELIVLNHSDYKSEVNFFNRSYSELPRKFNLNLEKDAPPTCLAVNEDNQIAIGRKIRQNISLYSRNGSLIDTLSNQKVGEHMTSYKQRWIYTNRMQRKLRSIYTNGDEIFAVDMPRCIPTSLGPEGVCCEKDGDIYVALSYAWSPSWGGEIHRFSADGEHIGCVIKGCGSPRGITLTPDSDLVVAAMESVRIYHHV
ncbi:tripartite motif-containing protein 59-like [Patiria miniata]|uniref:RING-type domain-containing protein n=1 Tax=Patiria miniata TaxID=46514 RepID=A0A914A516_PATMI|nr:tripartite motif-containing protein 59-like [Patiria miniata]